MNIKYYVKLNNSKIIKMTNEWPKNIGSQWPENTKQTSPGVFTPWAPPEPIQQQQWPVTTNQSLVQSASTNPLDAMTQDQVLLKWQELKDAVEKAKEAEMEMRKYIVKRAFPNATEGTNKIELGQGYELKAVVKYNYNLDPDLDKVEAALDDIANLGNEGAFLADRLVKWSASFLLTEYRKLSEPDATEIQKKIKKRIDEVLTITDAAPTLEIKEPKAKKK